LGSLWTATNTGLCGVTILFVAPASSVAFRLMIFPVVIVDERWKCQRRRRRTNPERRPPNSEPRFQKIPAVSAPQAHFEVAEDAVKLSLEQEEQVTTQINALLSIAKADSDYTADNFLQ
jgi:hypothetical protein